MSDNFVINPVNNSLAFPTFDDHPEIIRPLYELVSDVEEFCERMGFDVYPEPHCYNGVPVASKINFKKRKTGGTPRNKQPLHWTWTEVLAFFTRHPLIYMPFLKGLGGVFVLIVILHFYNKHQMALGKLDQEMENQRVIREAKKQVREETKKKLLQELSEIKERQRQR